MREGPYHPVLFFVQLVVTHLLAPLPFNTTVLVVALVCTAVTRVNYFWYVGIAISPGLGPLALVNVLFGVLSLNEPWKVTVLLYVAGDLYLLGASQVSLLYNVVAILALLYHFYEDLPFGSILANKLYFSGFAGFWVLQLMRYVEISLGIQIGGETVGAMLACVSVFSGVYLISRRVEAVINSPLEELSNINQFALYIESLRARLVLPLERVGIERAHRKCCQDVDCFCRKKDRVPFERLLVRLLHAQWEAKLRNTSDDHITEEYIIDNLLGENMFPLAIETYIRYKFSPADVFKLVYRRRIEARLRNELQKAENEYVEKMVFENAFDYETNYEIFKRDILEIIELKIKFWKEVNKSVSKLTILRELGEEILFKFNKMHNFYT